MQDSTKSYIRHFMAVIFVTTIVITVLLVVGSLKSQNHSSLNTSQAIYTLSTPDAVRPTQVTAQPTIDEKIQNTNVAHPIVEAQSSNLQEQSNTISSQVTFLMGALSGSLVTALIFITILTTRKRREMMEKALQQEKEYQWNRSRRRVNEKMDSLLGRFSRTADEIQQNRANTEVLMLRKSNKS